MGVHIFAGGFSLGVEKHFELLGHLERGGLGVASWRKNRPGVPVHVDKAGRWDEQVAALAGTGKVDLLYANPPCASWSPASNTTARNADSLSLDWTRDVLEVAKRVGAKVVAVESVRGALLRGVERYRSMAQEYKVNVAWVLVNAANHGLPQNRRRLFILFSQGGLFEPHFSPRPPVRTLDVIAGAPPDEPMSHDEMKYSVKHGVTNEDLARCIPIVPPGRLLQSVPLDVVERASSRVAAYMRAGGWFGGHCLYRFPTDDAPGVVVYGHQSRYIHPTEDRLLTVRELMRIQGYPDDYVFETANQGQAKIEMGKTVCPPVAEWLAGEISAYLRGERNVVYRREAVFTCALDKPRPSGVRRIEDLV